MAEAAFPGQPACARAELLPPLALAYLGDAVYELWVRQHLLAEGRVRVEELHRRAVDFVRAETQARLAERILPQLSAPEAEILRRGRNAKSGRLPRAGSAGDYHLATGLEALFGYLYLQGETARLGALFAELAAMLEG